MNVNIARVFFVTSRHTYDKVYGTGDLISGLALTHIHYGMELDLDNVFARKHKQTAKLVRIIQNQVPY